MMLVPDGGVDYTCLVPGVDGRCKRNANVGASTHVNDRVSSMLKTGPLVGDKPCLRGFFQTFTHQRPRSPYQTTHLN